MTTTFNQKLNSGHFDRSALRYHDHNIVQRQVFEHLISGIQTKHFQSILDIGCASGEFTDSLATLYSPSSIVGIDVSISMIETAKRRHSDSIATYRRSDILEFRSDQSFDLVFSNASIHWISDLNSLFKHCSSLMSSGSQFIFSVFLPSSLLTLSSAVRTVVGNDVTLVSQDFHPVEAYKKALKLNFSSIDCHTQSFFIEHPSFIDLLRSFKNTGVRGKRNDRIWTRSELQAIDAYLRATHVENSIVAQYDVAFFTCSF